MKLRNVERTTRDAVTTPDAILLLEIDDAVVELDDRAVGGTGAQTARIFTMHALVFAQQPHKVAVVLLVFYKLDQVVVVPLGGGHRLISIVEGGFAERMLIPLDTGDFTSLTTDAGGYIDVLANFVYAARAGARHRPGMRRDFLYLKCAWVTHRKSRRLVVTFVYNCENISVRIFEPRGAHLSGDVNVAFEFGIGKLVVL